MDYKSHFLDYDKTIFFKQRIAKALGVCEALIVQHINYHAETNNNIHGGHRWFYHTIENFQATFPFYSERTIRRAIDSLEKMGILITGKFSRLKTDRTKWYRIDAKELDAIVYKKTPGYLDEMRNTNMQNATGQSDQMGGVKNCQDGHIQLDRMATCSFKEERKDKKEIHTHQNQNDNENQSPQKDSGVCDQVNPEREEEDHTLSAPEKKENQSEQKQQCYDESNQGTKRRVKGTGHTSSNIKNEFSDDFLNFYSSYPKKISKGDAWKAWKQVSKQLPQIDELLAILEKHKAQEGWENHQYIPYPASWLRGLRWQDDVATVRVQQDLFGGHLKLQQDKGSLHDQLLNKAKESRGKNG